jgi:hypothetical protein
MITEEWARNAPAGPELDRVCAEWIGLRPIKYNGGLDGWWDGEAIGGGLPRYSTKWTHAGPLLEVMRGDLVFDANEHTWYCSRYHEGRDTTGHAPTPQLAIARACAVLVARGIPREDLG